MKNNISLLVGLKNNLDYNQHFYETTRELYPTVEICFVSYGSTDGTHEWLDSLQDPNVKSFYSTESKTFSDTFNKAAELATRPYVAYLHNDIVLAPGFLESLESHVSTSRVVSYTTIEPPIFADHSRPGKLIYHLGASLDTFDKPALHEYVAQQRSKYAGKTEPGITFFMCMPRAALLEIGGLDPLYNPMFCEDDDLIRRWKMYGMECITALDAMCYHFVSKTSRFSAEYERRTQQIELQSNRNYIRKWGSRTEAPKYNIAFVARNCTLPMLETLEPWCDRIYIDDYLHNIIDAYLDIEQPKTAYDLTKRVLRIDSNDPAGENDIVVVFDAGRLNTQNFQLIQQLAAIIADTGEIGEFEIDCFRISIFSLEQQQDQLIISKTKHIYT
jgi:GT2 family glycosyltransferase